MRRAREDLPEELKSIIQGFLDILDRGGPTKEDLPQFKELTTKLEIYMLTHDRSHYPYKE